MAVLFRTEYDSAQQSHVDIQGAAYQHFQTALCAKAVKEEKVNKTILGSLDNEARKAGLKGFVYDQ